MDKLEFAALKRGGSTIDIDGTQVHLRRLTLAERMEALKHIVRETGESREVRVTSAQKTCTYLVMHCVVDEAGNRIFSDEDENIVLEMDGQFVDTLADEIMYQNGLAKRAQDDAIKNCEPSPS